MAAKSPRASGLTPHRAIGDLPVAELTARGVGADGAHRLFEFLGPDVSASWTFLFGAIAEPILSASVTIGIADHDAAASGSQVASFSLDGTDLTAGMDALFEHNVYLLPLLSPSFPDLADGSATFALELDGAGLAFDLLGGATVGNTVQRRSPHLLDAEHHHARHPAARRPRTRDRAPAGNGASRGSSGTRRYLR